MHTQDHTSFLKTFLQALTFGPLPSFRSPPPPHPCNHHNSRVGLLPPHPCQTRVCMQQMSNNRHTCPTNLEIRNNSFLAQGHVEVAIIDLKATGAGVAGGSARVARRNPATTLLMCIISRRSCRRPGPPFSSSYNTAKPFHILHRCTL